MVINKDPENAHAVKLSFDDVQKGKSTFFTGQVSLTTFGKEQYQWHAGGHADGHANGQTNGPANPRSGFAAPDGPVAQSTVAARAGTNFSLPAASVTVIRGTIAP
jgi:hypothetical protein